MSYNSELKSNNIDLQSILDTINALPEAGSGNPTLQEKTVSPSTNSQDITPDNGYDGLSKVTVNAMPTAALELPSIVALSDGNVYATSQQSQGGYIAAGSRVTNNLKLSSAHDSDFVASNIKNGVTIFGLTGTFEGGGGLPAGISAVATGTFTLGNTITNPYTIAHDLGVAPDFVVVFGDENIDLSRFNDEQFFNVIVRKVITNHNTVPECDGYQVLVSGYSKNTYPLVQALTPAQVASQLTASSFTIHAESYYKLTFRYTYRWIAGVFG